MKKTIRWKADTIACDTGGLNEPSPYGLWLQSAGFATEGFP